MRETRIAKRYSLALFEAAKELNQLDQTYKDLQIVLHIFQKNSELTSIFVSPVISKNEKLNIIDEIFVQKAGVSDLVCNFLRLLVEKYRENIILESIDFFRHMYNKEKGFQEAEIISVVELDDSYLTKIGDILYKQFHKKFLFKKKVDPQILGGFIVKFEDKIIDASVRNDLFSLKKRILTENI